MVLRVTRLLCIYNSLLYDTVLWCQGKNSKALRTCRRKHKLNIRVHRIVLAKPFDAYLDLLA